MIRVMVAPIRGSLVDSAGDLSPIAPGPIEHMVEYDPSARGRLYDAWQSALVNEPVVGALAMVAGFRAYVSALAESDRRTLVLPVEPEDHPRVWPDDAPLYYAPDLGDDDVAVVSTGQALVAEVRKRAARGVADPKRAARGVADPKRWGTLVTAHIERMAACRGCIVVGPPQYSNVAMLYAPTCPVHGKGAGG